MTIVILLSVLRSESIVFSSWCYQHFCFWTSGNQKYHFATAPLVDIFILGWYIRYLFTFLFHFRCKSKISHNCLEVFELLLVLRTAKCALVPYALYDLHLMKLCGGQKIWLNWMSKPKSVTFCDPILKKNGPSFSIFSESCDAFLFIVFPSLFPILSTYL